MAGDVNNGGSFGVGQADAYAGGVRKEVIKTVSTNVMSNVEPTVVDTTVDVASVSTIPTQSGQFVSEVDQTNIQSVNTNIPTSTPGHQYIPPKKIEQSGQDQSSDSDQLEPDSPEKTNQSGQDQSSDSDQFEPDSPKKSGQDQSSDSDQLEPDNPEKSQTTTKSPIQSTTTLAPTTTVTTPPMVL